MTLPAQSLNLYLKKLSSTTKASWKVGSHDSQKAETELRNCKSQDCVNNFIVKTYSPKQFCSWSCAAKTNNKGRVLSKTTKLKIANALSAAPVTVLRSEIPKVVRYISPFVITKEELKKLYVNDQLSSTEIAKKFGVTNFRVLKRLKKHSILRRTSTETRNIMYTKQPPTYKFKKNLTNNEKLLYYSAIMLYWAEGAKSGEHTVDFANSDPKMQLLFLKALRQIYGVNERKLRVNLYCYSNQNPPSLINYWSNLLNIPKEQFDKPYVRHDFKLNKIGKMPHGVVHVRYSDKKLMMQIKAEIDIISSELI